MPPRYCFNKQSVLDEGRLVESDINELKNWLKNENYPDLSDEQIILFLLSCDNKQEATRNTIKAFYIAKNSGPELFDNRDVDRDELKYQLSIVHMSVLPQRTDDGSVIIYHKLNDTSYSNYNMEHAVKLLFMTLDASLVDYPPKGLICLFDMKGVGLMHLTKLKMGVIKKFFYFLQEALPIKLKELHVLNVVYFIDKIMTIIKPFMKKELMDMLHLHSSSIDMEEFYERYLPKKCLPQEYGGHLASVEQLHAANTKKLRELKSFFEDEQNQRLQYKPKQ